MYYLCKQITETTVKFTELALEDALLDGLDAMNFKETTPIQQQTIPIVLSGSDLIGCAQTGTGKTAAYLLPIINMLCKNRHDTDKTNALIMVPTRELAQQIDQQLEAFSFFLPISSIAVYGGGDGQIFSAQEKALRTGVDIAIATPGRLIALLNMGKIDMSGIQFFVLDEADRMLEMGFIDDIMRIASYLPKQKQTLLFSATMPPKIQLLAQKLLHNPQEVKLSISKPAEKIKQAAYVCHEAQKMPIIQSIFKDNAPKRVIIFSSSKQKVKELNVLLHRLHFKSAAIHSDLEQKEREEVLRQFKNGHIQLLIATDIVARGIDIEDIEMVINFDVPHDVEDYVHRIGRTARADADGAALTFISDKEQFQFKAIEDFIEREVTKLPVPSALGETPLYNPTRRPIGKGGHHHSRAQRHSESKSNTNGSQGHRKYKGNRPKRNTQGGMPKSNPTT